MTQAPKKTHVIRDPNSDIPPEDMQRASAAFMEDFKAIIAKHDVGFELLVLRYGEHIFTMRNAFSDIVLMSDDVGRNPEDLN